MASVSIKAYFNNNVKLFGQNSLYFKVHDSAHIAVIKEVYNEIFDTVLLSSLKGVTLGDDIELSIIDHIHARQEQERRIATGRDMPRKEPTQST